MQSSRNKIMQGKCGPLRVLRNGSSGCQVFQNPYVSVTFVFLLFLVIVILRSLWHLFILSAVKSQDKISGCFPLSMASALSTSSILLECPDLEYMSTRILLSPGQDERPYTAAVVLLTAILAGILLFQRPHFEKWRAACTVHIFTTVVCALNRKLCAVCIFSNEGVGSLQKVCKKCVLFALL